MLDKIISGGQTGADQVALRAARAPGVPTGGWAPKGWLTEDGPAPWLADFGLAECPEPGYSARTLANVRDSDVTLRFGTAADCALSLPSACPRPHAPGPSSRLGRQDLAEAVGAAADIPPVPPARPTDPDQPRGRSPVPVCRLSRHPRQSPWTARGGVRGRPTAGITG